MVSDPVNLSSFRQPLFLSLHTVGFPDGKHEGYKTTIVAPNGVFFTKVLFSGETTSRTKKTHSTNHGQGVSSCNIQRLTLKVEIIGFTSKVNICIKRGKVKAFHPSPMRNKRIFWFSLLVLESWI